jgi:hypothetical protein
MAGRFSRLNCKFYEVDISSFGRMNFRGRKINWLRVFGIYIYSYTMKGLYYVFHCITENKNSAFLLIGVCDLSCADVT